MRPVPILLLVALATPLALPPAGAEVCGGHVVLFTRASASPVGVNPSGAFCAPFNALGMDAPVDARVVNPGSDQAQVRYSVEVLGEESLVATLDGLGYDGEEVALVITQTATGQVVYDSAPLPLDPLARGSVTVTVRTLGGEALGATTYRTAA